MPLQSTLGTLDSGIVVRACAGIQTLISWTLRLQSIAQTCSPTSNCFGLFRPSKSSCYSIFCINNIFVIFIVEEGGGGATSIASKNSIPPRF